VRAKWYAAGDLSKACFVCPAKHECLAYSMHTLLQCPDCSESRIVYAETHYKCPAVTAWGKCLFRTTEPKFEVPTLPDDLEEYDCVSIASFPLQQRPRLFAIKDTVAHSVTTSCGRPERNSCDQSGGA